VRASLNSNCIATAFSKRRFPITQRAPGGGIPEPSSAPQCSAGFLWRCRWRCGSIRATGSRPWPDDDAQFLHFGEDALAFADADEDEIGGGRDVFQAQFAEGAREELQARELFLRVFLTCLSSSSAARAPACATELMLKG